ncbi:hypothetical protein PVAND_000884 [Polypedilum vanderplanki]|uniref:BTB domain-containing protein n=1 Tax=Polypedilum vanderplanki TaxID=319348 RepID=A0A9J6BL96_POLVA|nr:hypothetical protein PVAND_000884 [Polypedilum vanderplanki]
MEQKLIGEFTKNFNWRCTRENYLSSHKSNYIKSKHFESLTKIFPNLKYLGIVNSNLKIVTRNDLKEFTNLEILFLRGNEITYLPGDLLQDLNDLEVFVVSDSKIEMIEPKIFDNCKKLKHIDLRGNFCIDKCFSSVYPDLQNATMEEIKEKLQKIYPLWGEKVKNFKGEITSETLKLIKENLRYVKAINSLKMEKNFIKSEFQKFKNESKKEIEILKEKLSEIEAKNSNSESNFTQDFKTLMENEELKDITIKTELEEFKAHKFVLAARSPVFADIIKENVNAEYLNLLDISSDVFRVILDFIYTDELSENIDINLIELLIASERLKIENLKNVAEEKLMDEINSENAYEFLKLSTKIECEKLRQKAFEKIKKYYEGEKIDHEI